MVSATPPSYPFALQRARGTERGVEGIWVRWRDGTRAFVRYSSDVQPKSLQFTRNAPRHPLPAESIRLLMLAHLVSYVARLVRAR